MKTQRKIKLKFFQDENGMWGLTHEDTCRNDGGFDAFWSGIGIFHDVFEHAHEFADPHFRGEAALNVGGEVAAMGAMWFFINGAGMGGHLRSEFHSDRELTIATTLDQMTAAICANDTRFGSELVSHVPDQKPIPDATDLEELIAEHWDRVQALDPNDSENSPVSGPNEDGAAYKKSVTKEKLINLYRYGYRMAARLMGRSPFASAYILDQFLGYWENICKHNTAEELSNTFSGIDFTVGRGRRGALCWKAELIANYGSGAKNLVLRGGARGAPNQIYLEPEYIDQE